MSTLSQSSPLSERRKSSRQNKPKDFGWEMFLIVITLLLVAGFFISSDQLYESGDDLGYNLGLAGGLMMLTLLLYPARKRIGFMRNWGILPKWFKWHMVFGVLGPALILFHATFTIQSINAGVALACMLVVSGSGIFGRFFYTKIHNGLYGRSSSQQQLQEMLDGAGNIKSVFSFVPAIQQQLNEFSERALGGARKGKLNLWNSLSLQVKAEMLSRKLTSELEHAMMSSAQGKNWSGAQLKRLKEMFMQYKSFIRSYITAIRDLAQFSTYEKLFSLWHLGHLPLVYMLVFSAIWHVISVHKY